MAQAHSNHKWSSAVTRGSNALDLAKGVFLLPDAKQIARSLKHSAENSRRRKETPFQSAMAMLNFYINRAGSGLSPHRLTFLNQAKARLRKEFHKPAR